MENNEMVIIIPFYNPGEFLEQCIATAVSQKYDNYKMIFIDDMSTDDSWNKLPHDDDRAICIKNIVRKTALENIHDAIMNHCNEDSVCILLDGDDWFPNKKVLQYVDEQYNENDCWIMYGQSQWTDGRRGFASAYSAEEFKNIRKSPFRVSHLRTFRAGLYQKIKEQDSEFSCMKDSSGGFYKMTYDVAIMFPMLEMAGAEKVAFNDIILYIYNRNNPISDDKVNQQLQWDIHTEISNKPTFNKIEKYN
jgi:glycosyltransferase involved in cell wall biosynthesis